MSTPTRKLNGPLFCGYRSYFLEDMGWVGFSIGIHISSWRLDIHIAKWIISIGRVPIYNWPSKEDKEIAVSNSYHQGRINYYSKWYTKVRN